MTQLRDWTQLVDVKNAKDGGKSYSVRLTGSLGTRSIEIIIWLHIIDY